MNGKTVQIWRQWWCVVRGIMWALLVFPPDSQTTLTQWLQHSFLIIISPLDDQLADFKLGKGEAWGHVVPSAARSCGETGELAYGCSKLLLLFSWDPLTPKSQTKLAQSQDSIMWDRNLDEMHCVVLWASELGKIGRVSKLGQNVCQGHSAVNHLA